MFKPVRTVIFANPVEKADSKNCRKNRQRQREMDSFDMPFEKNGKGKYRENGNADKNPIPRPNAEYYRAFVKKRSDYSCSRLHSLCNQWNFKSLIAAHLPSDCSNNSPAAQTADCSENLHHKRFRCSDIENCPKNGSYAAEKSDGV